MTKMKYPEVAKRFIEAREKANLKQPEAARKIGITQQGISDIEQGKVKQPRAIDRFSKVYGKPKEWLLFGVTDNDNEDGLKEIRNLIPIIEWEDVKNHRELVKEFRKNPKPNPLKCVPVMGDNSLSCYALKVKNDFMSASPGVTPTFPPGINIIINPDKEVTDGCFVIFTQKGSKEPSFRKYEVDGANIFLTALKSHIPAIKVDDSIEILGVVTGFHGNV